MPKAGNSIKGSNETTPRGKPSFVHKVINNTIIATKAAWFESANTMLDSKPLINAKQIARPIA